MKSSSRSSPNEYGYGPIETSDSDSANTASAENTEEPEIEQSNTSSDDDSSSPSISLGEGDAAGTAAAESSGFHTPSYSRRSRTSSSASSSSQISSDTSSDEEPIDLKSLYCADKKKRVADRRNEMIRRKEEKKADKLRNMSTSFDSGTKKSFWPLMEDLMATGKLKPQSFAAWACEKFVTLLTLLIFIVGFVALVLYAAGVDQRSRLNFLDTSFPVILHIIGVGTSVLLKVFYDLSPTVGHLESMSLIIRSRMWLFPGVLGELKVNKRSEMDQMKILEIAMDEQEDQANGFQEWHGEEHRFSMLHFLKKCHFPEFRVLFRAFDIFPWNRVVQLKDVTKKDMLMGVARNQIVDAFPVLDFLSVCSSLPSVFNPVIYYRFIKHLAVHCMCRQRKVMKPLQFPRLVTRAEDIEEDDVSPERLLPFYERKEPLPWGTLRLKDCENRYNDMSFKANLMAFGVFGLCLAAYLTMLFGELFFYARVREIYTHHKKDSGGIEEYLLSLAANMSDTSSPAPPSRSAVYLDEDEIQEWVEEYEALHKFSGYAIFLLILVIPFGIQASALLAENSVYPLLVLGTLMTHIDNFSMEVDQYLTVLAVNHGSMKHHTTPHSEEGLSNRQRRLLRKKVDMTRDIALSWRMGRFFNEVTNDAKTINTSVAVMVLNFVCHLIPLNNFVLNPASQCVPTWLLLFCTMQVFCLVYIINWGINCNNMIDGGIDSLLHDWQLKFLMIGWSGGFLSEASDGFGKSQRLNFLRKRPKKKKKKRKKTTKDESSSDEETEDESTDTDSNLSSVKSEENEWKDGNVQYMAFFANNPNTDSTKEEEGIDEVLETIEANNRIHSIIRVLAHYEAETITPLSVLGVTLTQDMITLIVGFFGGSIIGLLTNILEDREHLRSAFMCHGFL